MKNEYQKPEIEIVSFTAFETMATNELEAYANGDELIYGSTGTADNIFG
ncbi:MAG: hypothetical protein IKK14_05645 [Oscillospiraceae bacterium]|nr:hypothetical protein [Oscillospiraceae bacterium]